jgi:hypothetical protein
VTDEAITAAAEAITKRADTAARTAMSTLNTTPTPTLSLSSLLVRRE